MGLFGRDSVHKAKKKAWSKDVERGGKILEGQRAELKRRREEEADRRAEAKRIAEIERHRKRTELLRARAAEREATARERRASKAARWGSSIFSGAEKGTGKVARGTSKAIKRRRKTKPKIDWF